MQLKKLYAQKKKKTNQRTSVGLLIHIFDINRE